MLLKTRHFGEIEIEESGIITFRDGIPGFEHIHRFVLLGKDVESPFGWLQAVDDPNYAFVVMDPFIVKKDYSFEIGDDVVEELGIEKPEEVMVLTVVVVPEDVTKMTTNLKAPIVINTKTHQGKQVILDNADYPVRHYIMNHSQAK